MYSLLNSPATAAIDPVNGVVHWRPGAADASTSDLFQVRVADNGSPSLSATQSFQVSVGALTRPSLSVAAAAGGQIQLQASGDSGPDYSLQTSTNLDDAAGWLTIETTNSPLLPFVWLLGATNFYSPTFFRLILGP
jgi:hypothetical protein